MHPVHVSRIESGEANVTIGTLAALAIAYLLALVVAVGLFFIVWWLLAPDGPLHGHALAAAPASSR